MEIAEGLLASLLVALAVAAFARRRGWGIAVPVMGAGIVFGLLPIGPNAPDNAGDVFLFVIAPLVFGEALSSSYFDIRRFRRPILALAIGLVVLSSIAVGWVASVIVPSLPLAMAFALGAILSPTDAVSVAAVAKRAALPRRIVTILEGESLVNDGTGLTLLRVALAAAAAGALTGGEVALVLVQSVLGGIAVGVVAGLVLVWSIRRGRDAVISNALVLVAPFPVYLGAEALDGSGILAVVTCALFATNAMMSDGSFRGRAASVAAWRQITFVLQAFAFFLVGIEIPQTIEALTDDDRRVLPVLVLAVLATLLASRLAFVLLMALLSRVGGSERLGLRDATVLAWAGARGPVSGLAAFSIPLGMGVEALVGERNLLLATTFLVVGATLLLAPTLRIVARIVRLRPDDDIEHSRDVQAKLASRGLEALTELIEDAVIAQRAVSVEAEDRVRDRLLASLHANDVTVSHEQEAGIVADTLRLERHVLAAQQEELLRLRDDEDYSDAVIRPILLQLDVQIAALNSRKPGQP